MRRMILSVAVAALWVAIPGGAFGAGQTLQYRETARGAAVVFSSCPYGDWTPTAPILCDDWEVDYLSVSSVMGGGSVSPTEPFRAFYQHTVTLVTATDATGITLEYGQSGPLTGTYDPQKLQFASMPATSVPLTSVDLQTGDSTSGGAVALSAFVWTAAGAIQRFGNDGPLGGLPGDYRDRCVTLNSNSNQKLVGAYVTGSVDGIGIETHELPPPAPGAPADAHGVIFDAWYRVTLVAHHCV